MKHKYKLTIEEGTDNEEIVFADKFEQQEDGSVKFHLCKEDPCPLRDEECSNTLKAGMKSIYING